MTAARRLGELLDLIQGEYLELPGLRLSGAEPGQVWDIDGAARSELLAALVDVRFLRRLPGSRAVKRERPSKARH